MNKKFIAIMIIFPLLISCSGQKKIYFNKTYTKDTNGFDILMEQFAANIENIWGIDEVLIAGIKDYVKYSYDYHTRGHIDFENGRIIIETISNIHPISNLHKAIINMLLIGSYPDNVDLYSDINNIRINKEPLLYDQVLDNTGQPIRWQGRASSFADYLIQNKLKKRTSGLNIIWSVSIPMIPNHLDKRAHKYLPLVRKAAEEYSIDASLILAIIQIESSFNPYAVSHSDALGLMQVVQHTAGIDVFRMKGRWGKPSRSYLFNPKNNIDVGAAYLSLLQNTYLGKIEDPLSRRYAVITAYNGGVNSVLRVFSSNRDDAFSTINNMSPSKVYQILTSNHPSVESRLYLNKVNSAQHSYHYF